jgi:crossover junction endodeoxyribonuclease RuvC
LIILGIDPGTTTTGFGLIDYDGHNFRALDYGSIETTPKASQAAKIKQLTSDLAKILKSSKPDQVSVEEIFFSKNVKTGIKVAECRGAIISELTRHGYDVNEYKPLVIKNNICGYGGADKKNVQKMVQLILNLKQLPEPDDAADALAIAICHANHLKQKQLLTSK